jgi:hypothetical protein
VACRPRVSQASLASGGGGRDVGGVDTARVPLELCSGGTLVGGGGGRGVSLMC